MNKTNQNIQNVNISYKFIKSMEVVEEKTSSFEEPQNGNEVNNISICQQEKEQEENKEKIPDNTVPHEQNSQLKESFQYGYSLFRDQQSNNIGQVVLNLHDEEEILKECQKIDSINTTQQNINALIQEENSLTFLLWSLSSKGLLTIQFIESIEKVFIKKMIQLHQQGRLKDIDDNMRMVLCLLTDLQFLRYPQMQFQPSFLIKEQDPHKDNHENQLNLQKVNDKLLPKQSYNGDLKRKEIQSQQLTINQGPHKHSNITSKAHTKFFFFLNKSMERLKVKKLIIQVCIKNQAWPLRFCLIDFFRRLIAIKSFFPSLFPSIVNQFKIIIGEFSLKKTQKLHQNYAKQILTSRYLKCLKIYSESDDILEAAQCIYSISIKKSIKQKISKLMHDQMVLSAKASAWQQQIYSNYESTNEKKLSKSLQRNSMEQNTMKLKYSSKEKQINISQKIFQKTKFLWNPIIRPKYFNLQNLSANHIQFDQAIHPQLNLDKSE